MKPVHVREQAGGAEGGERAEHAAERKEPRNCQRCNQSWGEYQGEGGDINITHVLERLRGVHEALVHGEEAIDGLREHEQWQQREDLSEYGRHLIRSHKQPRNGPYEKCRDRRERHG